MKDLRLSLDDKVYKALEKMAKALGMKPKPYILMILGLHVQKKEEE